MAPLAETDDDQYKSLLLTVPYSMLARKVDRRIILVVNAVSYLAGLLFMIAIGKCNHPVP